MRTVILDNGGSTIKANYSTEETPKVIPNTIFKCRDEKRRVFVADEVNELAHKSKMFYMLPYEKGYLVNWNVQLEIWDRLFGAEHFNVDFENTKLLLTDPNVLVPAFKDQVEEILFETYQFASVNRIAAPSLIARHEFIKNNVMASIVIDSGFSSTQITPFFAGGVLSEGIMRMDIGGKALTNQLKEWVSFRQLDLRDETYVLNQCKEDACFVSQDFTKDMQEAKLPRSQNTIARDYLLPDFMSSSRGTLQMPSNDPVDTQKLFMNIERFALPELLFTPSDVGLNQAGIPECVAQCVTEVNNSFPDIAAELHKNIICVGGNFKFDGILPRLMSELTQWCCQGADISLKLSNDPALHAWHCGRDLMKMGDKHLLQGFVSKADYLEHGSSISEGKQERNFFSF